jgi:peptidoglycan/xylan/chitin deacetylase (PgdA/CDA1 family)
LPQNRFHHPEDAREQLVRALDLHRKVFGVRPQGVWPSEGSVSEETLAIAHSLGIKWMATDEGVLGRSTGVFFSAMATDGCRRIWPSGSITFTATRTARPRCTWCFATTPFRT